MVVETRVIVELERCYLQQKGGWTQRFHGWRPRMLEAVSLGLAMGLVVGCSQLLYGLCVIVHVNSIHPARHELCQVAKILVLFKD